MIDIYPFLRFSGSNFNPSWTCAVCGEIVKYGDGQAHFRDFHKDIKAVPKVKRTRTIPYNPMREYKESHGCSCLVCRNLIYPSERIYRHLKKVHNLRIIVVDAVSEKPWEDPESLFCDAEFLEREIIHKKVLSGEECKND